MMIHHQTNPLEGEIARKADKFIIIFLLKRFRANSNFSCE